MKVKVQTLDAKAGGDGAGEAPAADESKEG